MSVIELHSANRAAVLALLSDDTWCIACLCAAWCNTCGAFRASFDTLALRHPDKILVWIDIEDESDVVGDFDVDNFPTLLIQRGAEVVFLGTIEPNTAVAQRLVESCTKAGEGNHAPGFDLRANLSSIITRSPS